MSRGHKNLYVAERDRASLYRLRAKVGDRNHWRARQTDCQSSRSEVRRDVRAMRRSIQPQDQLIRWTHLGSGSMPNIPLKSPSNYIRPMPTIPLTGGPNFAISSMGTRGPFSWASLAPCSRSISAL